MACTSLPLSGKGSAWTEITILVALADGQAWLPRLRGWWKNDMFGAGPVLDRDTSCDGLRMVLGTQESSVFSAAACFGDKTVVLVIWTVHLWRWSWMLVQVDVCSETGCQNHGYRNSDGICCCRAERNSIMVRQRGGNTTVHKQTSGGFLFITQIWLYYH